MALFVFALESEAVLSLQHAVYAHLLGQRIVAYHLIACAIAQHLGQAGLLILRLFALLEYIHQCYFAVSADTANLFHI